MVDTDEMFAESARLIGQAGAGSLSAAQALDPWFAYCERVGPECRSLWQDLRQLKFGEDADAMTAWLQKLLQSQERAIASGHDSGDFHRLTVLQAEI